MSDLWSDRRASARRAVEPLALRMRPRTLSEVVGQRHILGPGRLLTRMLDAGALTSILLHGPPGTGKTTLAEVIANHTRAHFVRENAARVGVARIREIIAGAGRRLEENAGRTILFLDEIHRFSKSQQDALLADVEHGVIILIGATTENPLFAVNSALVSRSTVFRLEPLSEDDIAELVRRASADDERGLGALRLTIDDDALAHWARMSDGDARRALTALEIAAMSGATTDSGAGVSPVRRDSLRTPDLSKAKARAEASTSPCSPRPAARAPGSNKDASAAGVRPAQTKTSPIHITLADAQESIQRKALAYSRDGDEHYDLISALIKSVRGSDPDAAVYWLARMIEAGEDPRFLARRLAILASEDIGNADPHALSVAEACWSLIERIGMPEARITLSQCATYLALSPKSNAAYRAIDAALADVRTGATIPVPVFLRDAHKVESVGSAAEGAGYDYSHAKGARTSLGGVTDQDYLGVGKHYYQPIEVGFEQTLAQRLDELRQRRRHGP